MPDTEIHISLGIQTLTFNDTGAVMPKILNLVSGTGITFDSTVDPLDPTKVNVTINSTGGSPDQTHLILENVRDFEADPLDDGDSFTVETTLPEGTRFERLWSLSSGLSGTPTEPDGSIYLQFGIDTDQPICYPNIDIANDSSISYAGTLPTTAINRNIIVTAVGGSITAGTLDKLSFLILK